MDFNALLRHNYAIWGCRECYGNYYLYIYNNFRLFTELDVILNWNFYILGSYCNFENQGYAQFNEYILDQSEHSRSFGSTNLYTYSFICKYTFYVHNCLIKIGNCAVSLLHCNLSWRTVKTVQISIIKVL
jgi:hypothetical protein